MLGDESVRSVRHVDRQSIPQCQRLRNRLQPEVRARDWFWGYLL